MVDILKDAKWHVTLIILTTCIWGGIHMEHITNLFEQYYIPLMPIHDQ